MDKQTFQIALVKKGMPACALAKHLGIDRSTMSRIVNGWTEPTSDIKKRMSEILEVGEEDLFVGAIDESKR